MFYHIIATNPYYFSWNIKGECCSTGTTKFRLHNGNIITNTDIPQIMTINADKSISFTPECNISTVNLVLENVRKNVYKIKDLNTGAYIRHYASKLYLHDKEKNAIFDADSNWIFFNSMNAEYIIARYNEDISWTRYLDNNADVFIYNKGLPNISSTGRIINLDNYGREGHTYLYHIAMRYETHILPNKKYIFLQGDPFPHSPFLLELLCDSTEELCSFKGLSLWYTNTWPDPKITQRFMNQNKTTTTYILSENLEYVGFKTKFYLVGGNTNNDPLVIADFMKKYEITKQNPGFLVCLSGLFMTSANGIKSKSLEFWKRLLDASLENKINGYILELLWPSIFECV